MYILSRPTNVQPFVTKHSVYRHNTSSSFNFISFTTITKRTIQIILVGTDVGEETGGNPAVRCGEDMTNPHAEAGYRTVGD